MSISDPPPADAQINLNSRISSVELSIIASDFRPVASGLGRLSASVPAGIYQVVARAGPVVERTLVSVAPGGEYRDDNVDIKFPAPAPVNDTSTTHEYHQSAVEQATGMIGQMAGPPSGLVLVVRDVRGTNGPPLEPGDIAGFSLLDESLNPVPGFDASWRLEQGTAIATWSGRLPPGGYALRIDPSKINSAVRAPRSSQAFDQSIWLSETWQTIVFITTGAGGPQLSAASVHMARLDTTWSPYDTPVGLALELANWGLREGRSILPDDLLNVLLGTKFTNPMLGIVGAHSMLLQSDPDFGLFQTVLDNLDDMVPGHPDVAALRWIAARRAGTTTAPAVAATWPPMMLASYRALIAMDAIDTNAIANRSPAEVCAAQLLVQGIWTSWTPVTLPAEPPVPPPPTLGGSPEDAAPQESILPALGNDPQLIEKVALDDPATARVAGYLTALAALEGQTGRADRFATLTSGDIALATTLPVATVDRALDKIGAAAIPTATTTGGGGGGGGGGLLTWGTALFVAGALLLVGAVGAVAWCSGNDACPVRLGSQPTSSPTNSPTIPPTAPPTIPPTAPPTMSPTPPPTEPPTPAITMVPLGLPPTLDFGQITVGGLTGQQQLTVVAPEPVTLTFELTANPADAFALDPACAWTEELDGGYSCTAQLTFTPRLETKYVGSVTVFVNGELAGHGVQLTGEGVLRFLRYPTDPLNFDAVLVGMPTPRSVTIYSDEPAHLEFAVLDDSAQVFVTDSSCDLMVNDSGLYECTVTVTFTPNADVEFHASLGIYAGEPEPRRIELIGFGYING